MRRLLSFPNPVNEVSARVVAGGVVLMASAFLVTRSGWVLVPLTYGFIARVLAGPRFSPLGLLATRAVTPRLPRSWDRFVAGPPKRFAQGIGATFTVLASLAWVAGLEPLSFLLIAGLFVAAVLESGFALCLGCLMFNRLIEWGLVPQSVCEACGDLGGRLAAARRGQASASS